MDVLEIVLLMLLVVVCIALGALVLIQQGRGSDIGAAFGSGAANTIFGSSGATPFLVKFTAMLAIGFFAVTFALAYTAKQKSDLQQGSYDFGDGAPQQEESLDDLLIPSDEAELPLGEQDSSLDPEGDELPATDTTSNEGDILESLLNEEDVGDALPPEEESGEGDEFPNF